MEIDEDKKIAKILKKANRNKPQFGLASVPTQVRVDLVKSMVVLLNSLRIIR